MTTRCVATQQALMDAEGQATRLAASEQEHVASCPECSAVAAGERALGALLAQALPPDDPGLCESVIAALPAARRRRRLVALLPVAAALAVTVAGVALVGGVPGGGLVALLPAWSSQGWLALSAAAADWMTAILAVARGAGSLVPATAMMAALALAFLGVVSTLAVAARWRKRRAWQRGR